MQSEKAKTREIFRQRQGALFDERAFNRLWKSTTQHIRRIGGDQINASVEARYHLTRTGESILDYTYSVGGARGQKEAIRDYFVKRLTIERTTNFMQKYGGFVVDGHRFSTYVKWFNQGKITKDEYYDKIELFKQTSKKYLSAGSK